MIHLLEDVYQSLNFRLKEALPFINKQFELVEVRENILFEYVGKGNGKTVLVDKNGIFNAWLREGDVPTDVDVSPIIGCSEIVSMSIPTQLIIVGKRTEMLCDDNYQLDRLGIQTQALLNGNLKDLRKKHSLFGLSLVANGYGIDSRFTANEKFIALRSQFNLVLQATNKCLIQICNQY